MMQDDFKRNKTYDHLPPTIGGGFFSDFLSGITKDTMKSTAEAAGKATLKGVVDGTKKTLSEGTKKARKKITRKVLGEGYPTLSAKANVLCLDEITCHTKKVMKKCEGGEKLTKIEKELFDFFEK